MSDRSDSLLNQTFLRVGESAFPNHYTDTLVHATLRSEGLVSKNVVGFGLPKDLTFIKIQISVEVVLKVAPNTHFILNVATLVLSAQ